MCEKFEKEKARGKGTKNFFLLHYLRNPINDKQFLFVVSKWNKAFCKDLHV